LTSCLGAHFRRSACAWYLSYLTALWREDWRETRQDLSS
jgi:hypothetical protein